jgi:SAM-dependent methyltransferase
VIVERALSPAEFRAVWHSKPVLRAVYRDYYRRMAEWCGPGPTLEIGAGSGNLRETLPGVIASDIVPCPWLDAVVDAQALPFADRSLGNVLGVDVVHHIQYPRRFLGEIRRVLRPGGRLIVLEPAITPVSRLVFALGHPEPVDMGADPLADGTPDPSKDPMDSNQAIPTLLAGRHRSRLEKRFPDLRVVHSQILGLAAYPLSGGFRPWSLLPAVLVEPVLAIEERLAPRLGRLAGFRLLLVLERVGGFGPGASAP